MSSTTINRVTPTGILVTDAPPETPEWFAARSAGITGTDLPKILGLSRYGNALSVWLNKRGEEPEDVAGEAAHWGHIFEEPVAQEWARRHRARVLPIGVVAHEENQHWRASLDRLVIPSTCPDPDGALCGLEVKTRNQYVAGRFREDVPDDVLAQVAWGLRVTGLHHMHVAVLIGGQELKSFRVDRDEALESMLIEEAERVWTAFLDGVPPQAAPDAEGVLLDLLNRLYTERAGDREIDASEAQRWLDQYAEGGDLESRGKGLKMQAKSALVQMLDDGDRALIDGAPVFTYKAPAPSHHMPADALRQLATAEPEIYAHLIEEGFITPKSNGPRFSLALKEK